MSHQTTVPPVEGDYGERFLSIADLGRRYGKCRMTIHRWVKAGILPCPVVIGIRGRAFRYSEILACEASWPRAKPVSWAA